MSRSFWSLGSQRGAEEREKAASTENPPPEADGPVVRAEDVKAELARLSADVSRLCEAQAEMRAALDSRSDGSGSGPAGAAVQSAESSVWQSAPLGARLRFLAELLEEDHPLHKPVREAESLIGLARRGSELEDWLGSYPSLFVDAYTALIPGLIADPSPRDAPAVEVVAHAALGAARDVLDGQLDGFGVTWIAPAAGEAPGAEHVIAGEEASAEATPGSIVRCARRGLRRRGRVLLPAQVIVAGVSSPAASGGSESSTGAPPEEPQIETAPGGVSAAPPANEWPDWLRSLHRESQREASPAVTKAVADLCRLVECLTGPEPIEDEALRSLVATLVPLLVGTRTDEISGNWAEALARERPSIEAWLRDHAAVEIVAPAAGDAFDSAWMEATSIRRTAHPHEHGLVAKLERPGLLREGRMVLPARVIQYSPGESE